MHFLRIFDLLSWDHPAQLRGMRASSFGYVIPFRCTELHCIRQCIVGVSIVWNHVHEIRNAANIIGSCYEIYALEFFNITWARLKVLNFFWCQVACMLHLLGVLNGYVTAKESWNTTMVNLMRTPISVTFFTLCTISLLDVDFVSPFQRQTCCCTVPIIEVSYDTLFKECLFIVSSEASSLLKVMQWFFDFVLISHTTLPWHGACLWDISLSLSLPDETVSHIILWKYWLCLFASYLLQKVEVVGWIVLSCFAVKLRVHENWWHTLLAIWCFVWIGNDSFLEKSANCVKFAATLPNFLLISDEHILKCIFWGIW